MGNRPSDLTPNDQRSITKNPNSPEYESDQANQQKQAGENAERERSTGGGKSGQDKAK